MTHGLTIEELRRLRSAAFATGCAAVRVVPLPTRWQIAGTPGAPVVLLADRLHYMAARAALAEAMRSPQFLEVA